MLASNFQVRPAELPVAEPRPICTSDVDAPLSKVILLLEAALENVWFPPAMKSKLLIVIDVLSDSVAAVPSLFVIMYLSPTPGVPAGLNDRVDQFVAPTQLAL
jgi:hypothetical protein